MKKAIILLLLLLGAGCVETTKQDGQVKVSTFPDSSINIYNMQHDGHQWVVFFKQGYYSAVMDAHHSPNCPCQKNDSITTIEQ